MDLLIKLNVKDHKKVFVYNAPEEFEETLSSWKEMLEIDLISKEDQYPFVLIFVKDKAQLVKSKEILINNMDPSGLIWVAYPKKSSKKYKSDISRDYFWDALKDLGLEPVRQIAIDNDWSALRFKQGVDIKRKADKT